MDVLPDDPEIAAWQYAIAQEESNTDALTGVYNRKGFEEELKKIIAIAKRENIDFTVMMVDADKFKTINDTYGHPVGDKVLQAIANSLKIRLRKSDIVARYGGDEFVAILIRYNNTNYNELNDEVNKLIRDSISCVPEDELSVSIGFHPWDGKETADQIMINADRKMYNKKKPRRTGNYVAE